MRGWCVRSHALCRCFCLFVSAARQLPVQLDLARLGNALLELACTRGNVLSTGSIALQTQEDRDLKERLELAVERCKDPSPEIQRMAIEILRKEIRESTR